MKNLEYSKLDLADNTLYRKHLSLCNDIPSDWFTSLIWGYSNFMPTERAYAEGLCWQHLCEHGEDIEYAPIGDWDHTDWVDVFERYVAPGTVFDYVPGALKEQWESIFPGRFTITTNRNKWDYIYDLQGFATDTETKRRMLNNFHEKYEATIVPITAANTDEVHTLSSIADNRIKDIYAEEENLTELDEDDKAMSYVLDNWEAFDSIEGFLLRVRGQYISYMIWDAIDDRIACLFSKMIHGYAGVHEAMVEELCRRNLIKGRRWVNYTCDAGFEGLRKAKMLRNPARLLEKYRMVWLG